MTKSKLESRDQGEDLVQNEDMWWRGKLCKRVRILITVKSLFKCHTQRKKKKMVLCRGHYQRENYAENEQAAKN